MAIPQIPVNGTETVTHRRRVAESINDIISHRFDDWRRQTEAEKAAGVTPSNYAYPPLNILRYGAVGDGSTNCTAALQAAILASRKYAETRLDTIGGDSITMYRSAVIEIPEGIFVLDFDTFELTQEMGITLRGHGSRRFTNAIKGASTLLFSGTSSGYGFYLHRNGARSMHFEDLDICYADANFTGHLIDMIDAPGLKFRRCYLGCYGITAGTRVQSAASLLRLTYLEDVSLEDCTLDGAVDGIWSDDTRTEFANTFGGWGLSLSRCTFYDFTGDMVRHDGNRTLSNVSMERCNFNPINVDCVRSVDLVNADGVTLKNCIFTPSTSAKAGTEWMRLSGATGSVEDCTFSDLAKSGTLNGQLHVNNNTVFCTDGFTLTGGVISGNGNEFSQGTHGWTIAPSEDICIDLGPDLFKAGISGNSYRIASDSSFLAGRINYNRTSDASSSKFTNASDRISILNVDGKRFYDTSATLTLSILDTGRTIIANHSSGQTYTLPAPIPGCELSVGKESNQTLQVTAGSAIIRTGYGATKTSISAANATDIGGFLRFRAIDTTGWQLVARVGDWTLA